MNSGFPEAKRKKKTNMKQNWIATYYDKKDRVICTEPINDRTEHEATNEAMGLMPAKCEDWSLIPVKEKED